MAKIKYNDEKHWVNKLCKDYDINEHQLSHITGIRQSTLSTSRKRGSKLSNIGVFEKISKNMGISEDELKNKYR